MTHKHVRAKKKLLEQLEKTPVIDYACQKVGVSRSTYYRWLNIDSEFKSNAINAEERGRLSVNDVAESKLIQKINDSDMRAITYWLESNHKKYIKPRRPVIFQTSDNEAQPILVKFVGVDDAHYDTMQEYSTAKLKEAKKYIAEHPDNDDDVS